MHTTFGVRTPARNCFVNITHEVEKAAAKLGVVNGAVLVYVPHTTAAVTINESADPDVVRDIDSKLSSLVPDTESYRHREGNSDAHVKSSLTDSSLSIPVSNGQLRLGTWQGIFLCEHRRHASRRRLVLTLQGE